MTTFESSLVPEETEVRSINKPTNGFLGIVGQNILHNEVPRLLASRAIAIPEEIRQRTSLTFTENAARAAEIILASQDNGSSLTLSDTDGVFVYAGSLFDEQQFAALESLQSQQHKFLVTTNRKPFFPFTNSISEQVKSRKVEIFLGQDQQNPFNNEPYIREALLTSVGDFVASKDGRLERVNFVFDTLNLLPLTWYDFMRGTGITNAFFPQFVVNELVKSHKIPHDLLPKINLFAINPFIKNPLTIDY